MVEFHVATYSQDRKPHAQFKTFMAFVSCGADRRHPEESCQSLLSTKGHALRRGKPGSRCS